MQLSLSLPKFATTRSTANGVRHRGFLKPDAQQICMPSACMQSAVSMRTPVLPGCEPSTSCSTRKARKVAVCASASEGDAPVYVLPPVNDPAFEKEWLQLQMLEWLNEEWPAPTTVEPHAKLAEAVAMAYMKARASGQNDMTDILLALSTQLSASFDFFDTFTDPFEVSNKATEVLMLRDGADVCCANEADKARVGRVTDTFHAQRS
ncbi:hypothetical protein DUNSADRAFT_2858 [Dunaliella salina]|uniref:Uncharacterized protein n=1 Tax=Dunaliella salina TaxID=3046 RepID=A0ABQ7GV23_DUNSA|nr:hypothetical protein DUNSADRAFT_2858 [Dunaliella salina]|eukprot:KAF5838464.1 hypothetical protein DUNSADRAFT_2858 [Dunaliella salina]